VLLYVWW